MSRRLHENAVQFIGEKICEPAEGGVYHLVKLICSHDRSYNPQNCCIYCTSNRPVKLSRFNYFTARRVVKESTGRMQSVEPVHQSPPWLQEKVISHSEHIRI